MRSHEQMMDLILHVARRDERVRAVCMNGSRTNPNAPADPFQDYDIVYLVTELDSFLRDSDWVDVFGERIIMQTPENMAMFPSESLGRFAYLMLFQDGNRIDLTLIPVTDQEKYLREDKLTVVLLDKDGGLPKLPPPSDEDYRVKPPSPEFFADCCNEFWWVSTYVAKGLWRQEMLYAQDHLHQVVRPMLVKMLEWQVGIQTDFSLSIGKNGKYLEKYMSKTNWDAFMSTYSCRSYEETWEALFTICRLFRDSALFVSSHFGFEYPDRDDRHVTAYLERVRSLPSDAVEIY